jgi:ribosomal protein L7Ae-like RNA K-turn-binding protein
VQDDVRRKVAGLIGLGLRGRNVVVGVEQVRVAAVKNRLAYAIVAPDASENSRDKLVPLLNARRVRFAEPLSAEELGAAVGRDTTAAVGIIDGTLARGIRELVEGAPPARESRATPAPTRRKA